MAAAVVTNQDGKPTIHTVSPIIKGFAGERAQSRGLLHGLFVQRGACSHPFALDAQKSLDSCSASRFYG